MELGPQGRGIRTGVDVPKTGRWGAETSIICAELSMNKVPGRTICKIEF